MPEQVLLAFELKRAQTNELGPEGCTRDDGGLGRAARPTQRDRRQHRREPTLNFVPAVHDDPDHPDPLLVELYRSLPDADDPEPWLDWCRGAAEVLYIGVGTGRLAVPLSRAGVRLIGVDAHPGMLAHLRSRLPEVELIQARVEDLDLGRQFDFVMAPSHLLASHERLRAAARHCRGRIAIQLLNPYWLAGPSHPGVRVHELGHDRARLEVSYPGGWTHPATVDLVWPEGMEAFLDAAGLRLLLLRGEDPEAGLEESPTFYALAARSSRRARIPST